MHMEELLNAQELFALLAGKGELTKYKMMLLLDESEWQSRCKMGRIVAHFKRRNFSHSYKKGLLIYHFTPNEKQTMVEMLKNFPRFKEKMEGEKQNGQEKGRNK